MLIALTASTTTPNRCAAAHSRASRSAATPATARSSTCRPRRTQERTSTTGSSPSSLTRSLTGTPDSCSTHRISATPPRCLKDKTQAGSDRLRHEQLTALTHRRTAGPRSPHGCATLLTAHLELPRAVDDGPSDPALLSCFIAESQLAGPVSSADSRRFDLVAVCALAGTSAHRSAITGSLTPPAHPSSQPGSPRRAASTEMGAHPAVRSKRTVIPLSGATSRPSATLRRNLARTSDRAAQEDVAAVNRRHRQRTQLPDRHLLSLNGHRPRRRGVPAVLDGPTPGHYAASDGQSHSRDRFPTHGALLLLGDDVHSSTAPRQGLSDRR